MDILQLVKDFISSNGFDDLMVTDFFQDGSAATYNFETKMLEINQSAFYKEANRMNLPVEDVVYIIVSHELGHAIDRDIEKLFNKKIQVYELLKEKGYDEGIINEGVQALIQAEKNAWKNGEQFVPHRLKEKYLQVATQNISLHEVNIRKHLIEFAKKVQEIKEWL
jgi:hypothetical protein